MVNSEYLLEMHNISKSFVGVQALNNVSLQVRPGTVHALLGENGAGKSTLMKILAGESHSDQGEIKLNGESCYFSNRKSAIAHGISIIHQEMINVLEMTVAENMFLGREYKKKGKLFLDRSKIFNRTKELLNEIGLDISPSRKMKSLTVAEMQMCEIAKAVSYDSKIFIMDEPTSAITKNETEVLFKLIKRIISKGHSIIYISHKLEEIYTIADEISVLRDGHKVAFFDNTDVDENVLIKHMVDRDVIDVFPKREPVTDGKTAIQVKNLKIEGVFEDINFKVNKGEIFGLAGLMGSGRTEVVEAIFGITDLDEGDIFIEDEVKKIQNPMHAINNGIGLIPDDRKLKGLILNLDVMDNVVLANMRSFKRGMLKFLDWAQIQEKSDGFKKLLKIKTPSLKQKVVNLSGGNQQKVVLSKWLARDCDILIFDEPTRGIDIASQVRFLSSYF